MKKKIDLTLDVVIREIPDEDKDNENKAEQKTSNPRKKQAKKKK